MKRQDAKTLLGILGECCCCCEKSKPEAPAAPLLPITTRSNAPGQAGQAGSLSSMPVRRGLVLDEPFIPPVQEVDSPQVWDLMLTPASIPPENPKIAPEYTVGIGDMRVNPGAADDGSRVPELTHVDHVQRLGWNINPETQKDILASVNMPGVPVVYQVPHTYKNREGNDSGIVPLPDSSNAWLRLISTTAQPALIRQSTRTQGTEFDYATAQTRTITESLPAEVLATWNRYQAFSPDGGETWPYLQGIQQYGWQPGVNGPLEWVVIREFVVGVNNADGFTNGHYRSLIYDTITGYPSNTTVGRPLYDCEWLDSPPPPAAREYDTSFRRTILYPNAVYVPSDSKNSAIPEIPPLRKPHFISQLFDGKGWESDGGVRCVLKARQERTPNVDGGPDTVKDIPASSISVNGAVQEGWDYWTACADGHGGCHLILCRADMVRVFPSLGAAVDVPWPEFVKLLGLPTGTTFVCADALIYHHTFPLERGWIGVEFPDGTRQAVQVVAFLAWRDADKKEWQKSKLTRPRNRKAWESYRDAGEPLPKRTVPLALGGVTPGIVYHAMRFERYGPPTDLGYDAIQLYAPELPRGEAVHHPVPVPKPTKNVSFAAPQDAPHTMLKIHGKGSIEGITVNGEPAAVYWLGREPPKTTRSRNVRAVAVWHQNAIKEGDTVTIESPGFTISRLTFSRGGTPVTADHSKD